LPIFSGLTSGRPELRRGDFEHVARLGLDAAGEGQGRRAEGVDVDIARPAEPVVLEMMRLEVGDGVRHVRLACEERLVEDDCLAAADAGCPADVLR
jgi:hypothetical protein